MAATGSCVMAEYRCENVATIKRRLPTRLRHAVRASMALKPGTIFLERPTRALPDRKGARCGIEPVGSVGWQTVNLAKTHPHKCSNLCLKEKRKNKIVLLPVLD